MKTTKNKYACCHQGMTTLNLIVACGVLIALLGVLFVGFRSIRRDFEMADIAKHEREQRENFRFFDETESTRVTILEARPGSSAETTLEGVVVLKDTKIIINGIDSRWGKNPADEKGIPVPRISTWTLTFPGKNKQVYIYTEQVRTNNYGITKAIEKDFSVADGADIEEVEAEVFPDQWIEMIPKLKEQFLQLVVETYRQENLKR